MAVRIDVYKDGTVSPSITWEPSHPLPAQPDGVLWEAGDGQRFARVIGDSEMRTTDPQIQQTNMTYPENFLKDGVIQYSKDTIKLSDTWVMRFKEDLGEHMWGLYCQHGFGFEDTNDVPTDPNIGPFKQQTIDCGLNLRKLVGEPFKTNHGEFIQVASVDTSVVPDYDSTNYYMTPHLMVKQTLVGNSKDNPLYYIAHQKYGDLEWCNISRYPLVHETRFLELFPEPPFLTEYFGQTVFVEALIFQGSNVYARFNGGWYLIERMEVSGKGSAFLDWRKYVSPWMKTPPPPVKGWTLGKE